MPKPKGKPRPLGAKLSRVGAKEAGGGNASGLRFGELFPSRNQTSLWETAKVAPVRFKLRHTQTQVA